MLYHPGIRRYELWIKSEKHLHEKGHGRREAVELKDGVLHEGLYVFVSISFSTAIN